ncbi:uncharacterized protein LOC115232406 [Argonauta hians]
MKKFTKVYCYIIKTSDILNISSILTGLYIIFLIVLLVYQSAHIRRLEKRNYNSKYDDEPQKHQDQLEFEVLPRPLYIQWGRRHCTALSTTEVYSGVVAGSSHGDAGGGSNVLCLPMEPQWGNYTAAVEAASTIYGSEYGNSGYDTDILNGHNIPCSVCQTNKPAVIMMLPGRNKCYPGWVQEYSGYLMTSYWKDSGRSSYICMDKQPETTRSGYRHEKCSFFYHVQAQCGSLPCPPYVNQKEITCAVCSKVHVADSEPVFSKELTPVRVDLS